MQKVNKTDLLYLELRKKISRMDDREPFPTVRALLAEFGVSQPTVEAALKMLKQQGLLTAHVGRGTFVCKQKSDRKKILLFQPNWPEQSVISMVDPFRQAAEKAGLDFEVQQYDYSEKTVPLTQIKGNPDLILLDSISAECFSPENIAAITKFPIPSLISRSYVPVQGINCINNDNNAAGIFLANYLYRMGHRKIGILLNEPRSSMDCERLKKSFAFAATAMNCRVEYLDCEIPYGERPDEKIRQFAAKIAEGEYDFTALFAISNYGGARMYEELCRLQVRIPEEISLLTNGDKPETTGVSSFDISYADYAESVMQLAWEILNDETGTQRQVELNDGVFIDRGSVGKIDCRNKTGKDKEITS